MASERSSGSSHGAEDEVFRQEQQSGDDNDSSLLTRYNELLDEYPVRTKAITASAVGAIGAAIGSRLSSPKKKINWIDVMAFALHGGILNGPISHYWFEWLDKNGPQSQSKSMLLDQLVVQPPLLVVMFVFLDMTRAALREIRPSIGRTLSTVGPTVVNSWRFWPIAVYCT
eukprot:scaffold117077_cov65-Attheya_sp.AAC.5